MGSNKKSTLYDEKLFEMVIYYYINSYYNYDEIALMLCIEKKTISKMVNDEEYISNYYGDEFLKEINDKRNIRQKIQKNDSYKFKSYLIKSIEHRSIVKEDFYFTEKGSILKLLDNVILFFQYQGNSIKMEKETKLFRNDIQFSLSAPELKDILKEDVYEKLEILLEYDKILTQNRLRERKELAEIMITDMKRLLLNKDEPWQPTIPINIIYRLLTEDPYVKIRYANCREELLKALEDYEYACNYEREVAKQHQLKSSTKG